MNQIKRTERGWAGHFIGASKCRYHRNTLLEFSETDKIVVSTVGAYSSSPLGRLTEIGFNRHYETMAFPAELKGSYWDAQVMLGEISFESNWRLAVDDVNGHNIDNLADEMHEAVVAEFIQRGWGRE